jgi:hypothetical protein
VFRFEGNRKIRMHSLGICDSEILQTALLYYSYTFDGPAVKDVFSA